jgi:hypothetical protein
MISPFSSAITKVWSDTFRGSILEKSLHQAGRASIPKYKVKSEVKPTGKSIWNKEISEISRKLFITFENHFINTMIVSSLSFYQLVKKLGVILWGLHNLFRMVYSL